MRCSPPSLVAVYALACLRTGLLARRAKIVEHAWVRIAREALGADGQGIPQQWLAHTTAPNVGAEDRRRLDLVVYGATPHGGALCCDATFVSPLTRTGHWPSDASTPRTRSLRPQKLVVLGSEVGGLHVCTCMFLACVLALGLQAACNFHRHAAWVYFNFSPTLPLLEARIMCFVPYVTLLLRLGIL